MTMNEGALTKDFDLVPGKWRINSSVPGFKVVAVALVGLRHRLFPLRQVEAREFTALVPFDDKNGEPIEPPVMLHGCRRCTITTASPSTCGRCRGMVGG
jgi:hypothetical protein